ncbi:hypothetical protein [Arcobacter lacus]|uniref:Uncharacterized protein n=1 Tax=Arcobacter lacus TaxID=1912876 RepID=A0ABX5JHA2_9BACT|nr:hypothetical protein [Arcobacter lacus]PUE66770.1 hypothetical protein B0175_05230 [Arcobacter lacus]
MKNLFNKLNVFNVGAVFSFFIWVFILLNAPSKNIINLNEAFSYLVWQESVHLYLTLTIIFCGFAILYKKRQ